MNELILKMYEEDKKNNKDHVATPRYIVDTIFNLIHIESYKSIWFPFDNFDSEFKLGADDLELNYYATHKFDNYGNDFFKTYPPKDCDLMISNPPFSIQNKILERSFNLIENGSIKSFCLLLPLSTLETPFRSDLFCKYYDKLCFIIFKKRIKFIGCKTSFNKGCCLVCYNIQAIKNKLSWL